jgi:small subunit ribosomal protein S16
MAVKIRLRRAGKVNEPSHRIVVADGRSPRDGRFIENIGIYDPRHKTERLDLARADYWLSHGAQASETVAAIIKRARAGVPMGCQPVATATVAQPVEESAPPAAAPANAEA